MHHGIIILAALATFLMLPAGAQGWGDRPPPHFGGGRPPPPPHHRPPPPPPPGGWWSTSPKVVTVEPGEHGPSSSPPGAVPAKQAAPGPMALSFRQGERRPDDVAIIIGNAAYSRFSRDLPDVIPARNDAALMGRYATQALGIEDRNLVILEDATAAQFSRLFGTERDHRGQLHDMLKPGRSRVLVYYSGHGASGVQDQGAYLVPVDADAARITLSGYPLATLLDNLGKLPASEITMVVEACFSGLSQSGSLIPAASPISIVARAPKVPPNVTLITAGAADQIASWEQDRSHSLFTKYFLMGQAGDADNNGDGKIGLDEVRAYLKETLTHLARRYWGRDQEAQIVKGGA